MSKRNLVAKLEAWAAWCHTRNLKAELQRDIYAASERITELEAEIERQREYVESYRRTANKLATRAAKADIEAERLRKERDYWQDGYNEMEAAQKETPTEG